MTSSTRRRKNSGLPQHSWRIRLREDGSSSRRVLVEALSQALLAAGPRTILRNKVKVRRNDLEIGTFSLKLSEFRRVLVIGGGKATAGMALEIEQILDGWITGGSVNIPAYTRQRPMAQEQEDQFQFSISSYSQRRWCSRSQKNAPTCRETLRRGLGDLPDLRRRFGTHATPIHGATALRQAEDD